VVTVWTMHVASVSSNELSSVIMTEVTTLAKAQHQPKHKLLELSTYG
jgi:hypothetical protein